MSKYVFVWGEEPIIEVDEWDEPQVGYTVIRKSIKADMTLGDALLIGFLTVITLAPIVIAIVVISISL